MYDERTVDDLVKIIRDLQADRDWWRDKAVDYAYDDEKCECDRCVAVRARHDSTN